MVKAIITDIEGTTTDIHFVHKVLFPYSRKRMADFLNTHQSLHEIATTLQAMREYLKKPTATLPELIDQLIAWIDADMKIGYLKTLQGYIWQQGFEQGDFKGHIYPDAYHQLTHWYDQGLDLYVYSSGSVQAQQLLFQYSDFGDLRYLFKGYFDTQVGAKKEAQSYANILQNLQLPGKQVLFLSDVIAELDAAHENQIKTFLLDRERTAIHAGNYRVVTSFHDILPSNIR